MAACRDCKYLLANQDGPRSKEWFNLTCLKHRVPKRFDPFLGIWVRDKTCLPIRDVNTGLSECPHFEEEVSSCDQS